MKYSIPTFILIFIISFSSPGQSFRVSPGDTLHSISIESSGMTTFRLFAPNAKEVRIGGPDIPMQFRLSPMTKQENGVWEQTIGPFVPGTYRYIFTVDSMAVMDPRNPSVSESNANSWSMFHVNGAEFMDMKNVPHGSVAEVNYFSTALQRFRRMHVYTPPGYSSGKKLFPVLYLLHGALDCDDSWTSVGRAGIIMDNLIAEGKAVPMIIVMPAGHTGPFTFGMPLVRPNKDEFTEDFTNDVRPYIEKNYAVQSDRSHRAVAGLSMGGFQTLNIAVPHLNEYSAFAVFSSGILEFGRNPANNNTGPSWEERNSAALDNKEFKKGLKHVWFATGKDDFLIQMSRSTVDILKKHGFTVTFAETEGGHTWENWRRYLNQFAPLLFQK